MRVLITGALAFIVLASGTRITAQTKVDRTEKVKREVLAATAKNPKPAAPLTSREVMAILQLEIDTAPFQEKLKFKHFLEHISDKLRSQNREVTIDVDLVGFAQELGADGLNPFETEIAINTNRQRAAIIDLLNQAVKQIARAPGALVIRAGRVDIAPASLTTKEHMFNQTFRADFKEQRLDAALDDLTDLTGVTLVLDPRARQKAQMPVTARFNGDVALQDAVRMLTEMADLKVVYLVTGLYVTTQEHAVRMQKELKQIYEPTPLVPDGMPNPMLNPMFPFVPSFAPELSPLAPPLPPQRKRLDAAA